MSGKAINILVYVSSIESDPIDSEPYRFRSLPGHLGGTNVSLGRFAPGQRQNIGHCLIHMGDRHDSVVANNEETGSTGNNKQVCKKKTPL